MKRAAKRNPMLKIVAVTVRRGERHGSRPKLKLGSRRPIGQEPHSQYRLKRAALTMET